MSNKEQMAQRRADLQSRLDTLKFALGTPGTNLDPLMTEEAKATMKSFKRLDLENQVRRAQDELAAIT